MGRPLTPILRCFISAKFLNFDPSIRIGVCLVIKSIHIFYLIIKIKFRPLRPSFLQISPIFGTNWVRLVGRYANFLTPISPIVRHYLRYNCAKNWNIATKFKPSTHSYFVSRGKKLTKTGLKVYIYVQQIACPKTVCGTPKDNLLLPPFVVSTTWSVDIIRQHK